MFYRRRAIKSDLEGRWARLLRSAVRGLRQFAYKNPSTSALKQEPGSRPRIGLALGGGFARGVAHVGVLKVLRDNGIPIDALAGTSAGSMAAAAFASGCSIDEMTEAVHRLRWNRFAGWTVSRLGFASNERMESFLTGMLRCRTFEELLIPLAIVAADVTTGESVVFRHGDLILPIRASCCFPGLFTPVKYCGRLLVDGVVAGSVPVAPLEEMGVDVIVGVHIAGHGIASRPTNLFQIVGDSFQIIQNLNQSSWRSQCDLVIEPKIEDVRWDEFERGDEVIAAGEAAARAALPALRRLVEKRPAGVTLTPRRRDGRPRLLWNPM